jgi:hypothetical protein
MSKMPIYEIEWDIEEIGVRPTSNWFDWNSIDSGSISTTIRCKLIEYLFYCPRCDNIFDNTNGKCPYCGKQL